MHVTHYTNPGTATPLDTAALAAATTTIDFAAYSLTEPAIIQTLAARAAAGVKIRLYLDRSELEAEARGNPALPSCPLNQLLNAPNLTIRVKASMVLMHLKSYLVDGKTLRDGSANFSPLGESQQDNSATFTDDPQAVANFAAKFETMWNRADNMSTTAAIETSASYAMHRAHSH
jgi:phosphatidylserine/phosphatidylglycerophosphate/cardiolipin synthase-like enzyme